MITPAGDAIYPPVKLWSTVSLPVESSLKTSPQPEPLHGDAPLEISVLDRFPAASKTQGALVRFRPSVQFAREQKV